MSCRCPVDGVGWDSTHLDSYRQETGGGKGLIQLRWTIMHRAGHAKPLLKGIHAFPTQAVFAREIEAHGFTDVSYENLTFGIVALHRGVKP